MIGNAIIEYVNRVGDLKREKLAVRVDVQRVTEDKMFFTCEGMVGEFYLDVEEGEVYSEDGVMIGDEASIDECSMFSW